MRGGADLVTNQMIAGRGQHPHLERGMSENTVEVQGRIEQDDLASACFDWSSDLVTGRPGRLLDTGSKQLLQKQWFLDCERIGL